MIKNTMDDLMSSWMGLCGGNVCSFHGVSVISIDLLLIVAFVIGLGCKASRADPLFRLTSPLRICSLAFNGCLGVVYLGFGLWQLGQKLGRDDGFFPLGWWVVLSLQGITLMVIGLMASIRTKLLGVVFVRIWSGIACALAVFVCSYSTRDFVVQKKVNVKLFLDVLTLPGAIMLLLCVFKGSIEYEDAKKMDDDSLRMPLNGRYNGNSINYDESVTPFAKAGFFSRMTFWWLNSVMKRGYEKPLEEKDMPKLSEEDRAEGCYSLFLDQLDKQKQAKKTASPSVLWTIVSCYKNEFLLSGFFALLKVLTLSAGPVLLKAFIKVSIGEADFKYEGFVLALAMFSSKCLESMSQRQWYFQTRLLGLKVRSLLSAAIYQKQVKLSNSSKLAHSSGEIMNYVTVDAYRIGEFPYWFHQTWTTSLQLCIALIILYNDVGFATISAMIVILLTVLCNAPLAKLQHKFQLRLIEAQDARLKAMSEALVNMKVLKLYAWETHFKNVIEELRAVELHWLSKVQLRRAYNAFLFWSSPVLVSAANFMTCYFIDVPLYPTDVAFVATLHLVQDPVHQIPEVIGVVIQVKVAFSHIVNFFDAPELQNGQSRRMYGADFNHSIVIKSASFSWDGTSLKSTLSDINMQVIVGEKVAICGEVSSGKSTLLAAILGEIPNTEGTVHVCGRTAYVSQNAWIQTGTYKRIFSSSLSWIIKDTRKHLKNVLW